MPPQHHVMSRTGLVLAPLLAIAIALPGCAAVVAVPAIGSAAASGGASALVRAGSAAVQGGTVYRTFDAPLTSVHDAVETTLARLEFPTPDEQVQQERVILSANAIERHVRVDLQPITPSLTQVSVTVSINFWQKDSATAATLIDLVTATLGPGCCDEARPCAPSPLAGHAAPRSTSIRKTPLAGVMRWTVACWAQLGASITPFHRRGAAGFHGHES